jgi:N-acetyl-anhydromuramyl-L-alanine amidase AmpD
VRLFEKIASLIRQLKLAISPKETGIASPLGVDADGWLVGDGVKHVPSHPSWFDGPFASEKPKAIVWHYTATKYGTGMNMAKRRARAFSEVKKEDPKLHVGSWHVTICRDGSIIQQVPLTHMAWHAGGKQRLNLPRLGHPNQHSIGIEQEGYGTEWPEEMIVAACRVTKAICDWAPMTKTRAGFGHRDCNKVKEDPGQLWYDAVLPRILAYTFGN